MTFLSTMDFFRPNGWLQCLKALCHAILQGFYMQKQRGLQEKFFLNHEKFFCNPLILCLLSFKPPCQQRRDKDIYHQHTHQLIGQDNRNILTHTHTG